MNADLLATARALLLGSASARFTAVARGGAASTPFCLAPDGAPLLVATVGAAVSVALDTGSGGPTLIVRGQAAATGEAAHSRWQRHHPAAKRAPVRIGAPHALLCVEGRQENIDYAELVRDTLFDSGTETRMVDHMNDDHVDALRDYCNHAGVSCERSTPHMAGVDCAGFFVLADDGLVRFAFPAPCRSALEVRQALVALARVARGHAPDSGDDAH